MHSIPLAIRLLKLLRELWQAADCQPFHVGHRALARELGCSAGSLPRLMAQLEEEGEISRQPCGNRYLVAIRVDQHRSTARLIDVDRSTTEPLIDSDRSTPGASDRSESINGHARHQDAANPETPPRSPHARASSESGGGDHDLFKTPPPTESLTPARASLESALFGDDCHPKVLAAILAANPALTLAEYLEQRERIPPGFGPGLLFDKLRAGQRLPPLHTTTERAIDLDRQAYGNLLRKGSDLDGIDPELARRWLGGGHAA